MVNFSKEIFIMKLVRIMHMIHALFMFIEKQVLTFGRIIRSPYVKN